MSKESQKALLGRWRKTTRSSGDEMYPDEIEFTDRGIYFGRKEPGEFTLWDSGGYEALPAGKVRISTANDAEIVYRFTVEDEVLTFTDEKGSRFQYRREG